VAYARAASTFKRQKNEFWMKHTFINNTDKLINVISAADYITQVTTLLPKATIKPVRHTNLSQTIIVNPLDVYTDKTKNYFIFTPAP
jgi:hypothetical protein